MSGARITEKPSGQEFIAITQVNKFLQRIFYMESQVHLMEDKPVYVVVTPSVDSKLPMLLMLRLRKKRLLRTRK